MLFIILGVESITMDLCGFWRLTCRLSSKVSKIVNMLDFSRNIVCKHGKTTLLFCFFRFEIYIYIWKIKEYRNTLICINCIIFPSH